MFSDPLFSLMAMLMLCFVGMLVMFLFVVRAVAAHTAIMREQAARQMSMLGDLEHQLMDISFILRRQKNADPGEAKEAEPQSQSHVQPQSQSQSQSQAQPQSQPHPQPGDISALMGAMPAMAARGAQHTGATPDEAPDLEGLIRPGQNIRLTQIETLADLDLPLSFDGVSKSGGARAGGGLDLRMES